MAVQPFIRKGTRSNATARRLLTATGIAQHVLDATIELENVAQDVVMQVRQYGTTFYVRSDKFLTRYYPIFLAHDTFQWRGSSVDPRVNAHYIAKAQRFLALVQQQEAVA